ncbi:hypothetical protein BT93_L3799 [Corymbia citriodora subsp. variegata]|uniref:Uncharacterized protein n=1 Tax=Corymbia citriodora subsp. variegata TaxID=360336 RepID=A0A8T0CGU5_CORYI|nr:hypothetical protein BT93_L3799 [Corymbia citriodora subsp. variegata]
MPEYKEIWCLQDSLILIDLDVALILQDASFQLLTDMQDSFWTYWMT